MRTHFFLFSFFLACLLVQCKLEETLSLTDGGSNCPNPPVARFEVSDTIININQKIKIVNQSDISAGGFDWDFGNGTTSMSYDPPDSIGYTNSGKYDVVLVVTNAAGCSATYRKSIQVNTSFIRRVGTPASSQVPLGAVERNDGTFHGLYRDGITIKSVIVAKNGQSQEVAVSLPFASNFSIGKTIENEGGFVLTGYDNGFVKVLGISSQQMPTSLNRQDIRYGGASSNFSYDAIVDEDKVVVTGYKSDDPLLPGITLVQSSNSQVLGSADVNHFSLTGYGAFSLIKKPTNQYLLAVNKLSPIPGSSSSRIITVSKQGDYLDLSLNLTPIIEVGQLIQLSDFSFAVWGKDQFNTAYVMGINVSTSDGQLTKAWERNLGTGSEIIDMIKTSDNQIALCMHVINEGSIRLLKFLPSATPSFTWDESFKRSSTSQLKPCSIANTQDGGVLIGAKDQTSTTQTFYMIKTDANGKVE